MNIDTDTQWSYWSGIKEYEAKNRGYLQTQIGNPEAPLTPPSLRPLFPSVPT